MKRKRITTDRRSRTSHDDPPPHHATKGPTVSSSLVGGVDEDQIEELRSKHGDLRRKVKIDRQALDREMARQPQRMSDVCESLALCRSLRDEAKELQDAVFGDLYSKYDEYLRGEGVVKPTKAQVDSRVKSHSAYRDARQRYKRLEALAGRWEGLLMTYQQRSSMLRGLGALHEAEYGESGSA